MRRISILFVVLLILTLLFYPIRYWLARPPDPGVLIVPAPMQASYYEMERVNYKDVKAKERRWWIQ